MRIHLLLALASSFLIGQVLHKTTVATDLRRGPDGEIIGRLGTKIPVEVTARINTESGTWCRLRFPAVGTVLCSALEPMPRAVTAVPVLGKPATSVQPISIASIKQITGFAGPVVLRKAPILGFDWATWHRVFELGGGQERIPRIIVALAPAGTKLFAETFDLFIREKLRSDFSSMMKVPLTFPDGRPFQIVPVQYDGWSAEHGTSSLGGGLSTTWLSPDRQHEVQAVFDIQPGKDDPHGAHWAKVYATNPSGFVNRMTIELDRHLFLRAATKP